MYISYRSKVIANITVFLQANRQKKKQTDRQTDRQAEKQTDRAKNYMFPIYRCTGINTRVKHTKVSCTPPGHNAHIRVECIHWTRKARCSYIPEKRKEQYHNIPLPHIAEFRHTTDI